MNNEKILELLFSDPDKIFELYEKGGGDYNELKQIQLGKRAAQDKYPEIVEKEYIDSSEFMFWISYLVERWLGDDIADMEVKFFKRSTLEEFERKLDEMTFWHKMRYLVDNKCLTEDDPYYIFLKDFKNLRNHLAHGRLHLLEYGGHPLSDPKGQIKLIADLRNSLIKSPLIVKQNLK